MWIPQLLTNLLGIVEHIPWENTAPWTRGAVGGQKDCCESWFHKTRRRGSKNRFGIWIVLWCLVNDDRQVISHSFWKDLTFLYVFFFCLVSLTGEPCGAASSPLASASPARNEAEMTSLSPQMAMTIDCDKLLSVPSGCPGNPPGVLTYRWETQASSLKVWGQKACKTRNWSQIPDCGSLDPWLSHTRFPGKIYARFQRGSELRERLMTIGIWLHYLLRSTSMRQRQTTRRRVFWCPCVPMNGAMTLSFWEPDCDFRLDRIPSSNWKGYLWLEGLPFLIKLAAQSDVSKTLRLAAHSGGLSNWTWWIL